MSSWCHSQVHRVPGVSWSQDKQKWVGNTAQFYRALDLCHLVSRGTACAQHLGGENRKSRNSVLSSATWRLGRQPGIGT